MRQVVARWTKYDEDEFGNRSNYCCANCDHYFGTFDYFEVVEHYRLNHSEIYKERLAAESMPGFVMMRRSE